jgi:hypothetical protein
VQDTRTIAPRSSSTHPVPVILSGARPSRSEGLGESKDPMPANTSNGFARRSPPWSVGRMPCVAVIAFLEHGVLRLHESRAVRKIHSAQDDRVYSQQFKVRFNMRIAGLKQVEELEANLNAILIGSAKTPALR